MHERGARPQHRGPAQHVAAVQSVKLTEIHHKSPACFVYEAMCRIGGETQGRAGDLLLRGRYVTGRASISSARKARILALSLAGSGWARKAASPATIISIGMPAKMVANNPAPGM